MSELAVVRARPRVGAFFDMDKTLIATNSGTLLMRHRYEQGEIGNLDLLRGIASYLQYKLGVLDIRSWAQSVLAEYRGKSESEIEKQAREWFDALIEPALYPEAERLVREHAAAGRCASSRRRSAGSGSGGPELRRREALLRPGDGQFFAWLLGFRIS